MEFNSAFKGLKSLYCYNLRYSEGTELSLNSDSTYCFFQIYFCSRTQSKYLTNFKAPNGRIVTVQCTGRDIK